MTQHPAIELVAALQLFDHHVFVVLVAGLPHYRLMQAGIERLSFHPHRRDTQLLEHVNQLLVEPLIAAMQGLGLLVLGVELLTGPIKVVNDRQDLAEGAAGDLQPLILKIAALTLAVIVEIGRQAHVLAVEIVVLLPELGEFGLELGHPRLGVGTGRGALIRCTAAGSARIGRSGLGGLGGRRLLHRRLGWLGAQGLAGTLKAVTAHADAHDNRF